MGNANELLSEEEINDVLDQNSDWLTYDNVVGIDIEEVEGQSSGEKSLEFVVDTLETEILEEIIKEKTDRGEELHLLDIPKSVEIQIHSVEELEESTWEEIPIRIREVGEIVEDELVEEEDIEDENAEDEEDIEEAQTKKRPCPGGYMVRTHSLKGRGICGNEH